MEYLLANFRLKLNIQGNLSLSNQLSIFSYVFQGFYGKNKRKRLTPNGLYRALIIIKYKDRSRSWGLFAHF